MASLFKGFFFGRVSQRERAPTLMGSTYLSFFDDPGRSLFPKSIARHKPVDPHPFRYRGSPCGKGIGRSPLGKTLDGSMAFFLTSLLIVWLYPNLNVCQGPWPPLGAHSSSCCPIR